MQNFIENSNEQLKKHGYRLTPQPQKILSVIEAAIEHLNIEQITARVQERNPYVSLSTVYRTLELFESLDLVREVHLPGGQSHYEPTNSHAHYHLVCRRCHATIHLDETLLGNLHKQLQENFHFHQLTLDLTAAGYCENCWQALQQQANREIEGEN